MIQQIKPSGNPAKTEKRLLYATAVWIVSFNQYFLLSYFL